MCSRSKILSNLCKVKSVIAVLVINIAVVCVYMLMISREDAVILRTSFVKHHIILSGLNCPLEAGILSVTTTDIWDSKVVQVTKHELELWIREI